MDKYIRVTDLNEVYELKKAGKCFSCIGSMVSNNGITDDFSREYYKLNPDYDEWVELDIENWKEWAPKCIGKACEVRKSPDCDWEPGVLRGFEIGGHYSLFKALLNNCNHCRVKKSLLEGE